MPRISLKERIEWLERELPPNPPRFRIHEDLPFAILRYDPEEEWELRQELHRLAARLNHARREAVLISIADLVWEAIRESEGIDAIIQLERERGFRAAQEQVNLYLSDEDFFPLPKLLAQKLAKCDPAVHVGLLWRAAAVGPGIYHLAKLLEEMQGKTRVPCVLFYPGRLRDTNALQYMGLSDRDAIASYRVKIYG